MFWLFPPFSSSLHPSFSLFGNSMSPIFISSSEVDYILQFKSFLEPHVLAIFPVFPHHHFLVFLFPVILKSFIFTSPIFSLLLTSYLIGFLIFLPQSAEEYATCAPRSLLTATSLWAKRSRLGAGEKTTVSEAG